MNIHEHFRGHNVQWIVFESTHVPEHIMRVLEPADQVWVPSAWGCQVLIDNGIAKEKIRIVPEGVDIQKFHAHARKRTPGQPFRFLSIGKYEERKSFDETLQAFAQAYGNMPDVELFIKSSYFKDGDQKSQALLSRIDDLGLTNVQVYWGEIDPDQITDLYRSSDVFIFPSKGEGWGLPLIEAAASGLPIITTMYSGQTEFLRPIASSVLSVDYVLSPITCPEYQTYYPDINDNFGLWARPDVYSIAQALKTARSNHAILAKNARKNSQRIRDQFNWTRSADTALTVMEQNRWF